MKRILLTATLAAALVVPGILAAQDAPPIAAQLGLTDVQVREKKHVDYGRIVTGTLPDGTRVEIDLDRHGKVEEIEARGRGRFPVEAVSALIPAPVLANASWPAGATLEKLEFEDDGRIEIEGRLASGQSFDAEFAADGRLIDFDTDD